MNAGYLRLSRDDDKRNYSSIENQKLIINQFAASRNLVIDRWYEDDGISGYKFDRPAFNQLLADLDSDIDIVFVKDFSRLGRHNAKVLLLLDQFLESQKRLIAIDDNYDSSNPDDDVIGIKTWYNERYVKDASKKVRSALHARQSEGTLMTLVPFGYKRNRDKKGQIEIIPQEAEYIKMIFNLYLQGSGYRKIANYLTDSQIPTPSMIRHKHELSEGRHTKRLIAARWSDGMIKDILSNDFYIGTLRLHKRARITIHGKDKRIPKEDHYTFENNHPAIIDIMTYDLAQEIKIKRAKNNYRGSRGRWLGSEIPNIFGSCLFCKDCGSRLTPIVRKTTAGSRKYYICSKYNTKGKQYCPAAHLIEDSELIGDVTNYIKLCRNALQEVISTYDMKDFESERKSPEDKRLTLRETINAKKDELRTLLSQKVKDLTSHPDNSNLINESYDAIQSEILSKINGLELKLDELDNSTLAPPGAKIKSSSALEVIDSIINNTTLHRRDIEILIDRIDIDENGLPDIQLKYGLSQLIQYDPAAELNRRENEIIMSAMKLINADTRGYTSAKSLSAKLTDAGFKKSKKSVIPYINLMIERNILQPTDNPLRPYTIIKSQEEINKLTSSYDQDLHLFMPNRRNAADGI